MCVAAYLWQGAGDVQGRVPFSHNPDKLDILAPLSIGVSIAHCQEPAGRSGLGLRYARNARPTPDEFTAGRALGCGKGEALDKAQKLSSCPMLVNWTFLGRFQACLGCNVRAGQATWFLVGLSATMVWPYN